MVSLESSLVVVELDDEVVEESESVSLSELPVLSCCVSVVSESP